MPPKGYLIRIMATPKNISGFSELLPEEQVIQNRIISCIERVYRLHGFAPMQTPAVELLSSLCSQGDDKEIFAVKRAFAEYGEDAEMGLHFDLTVPFARYVAQHFNDLNFPFRRSCLDRAWRGERPQKGRGREFYQFDIDTVSRDELPISCDAEVVTVVAKAFQDINVARFVVRMNNRKLLYGFCEAIGIESERVSSVAIAIDKLDKIGEEGVKRELRDGVGLSQEVVSKLWDFSGKRAAGSQILDVLNSFDIKNDLFESGKTEVRQIVELLPERILDTVNLDLSLVRGLAYYTGLVCEVVFPDYPTWPSMGGGGRYENLAGQFSKQNIPGVGASIGVSRVTQFILAEQLMPLGQKCPSKVLVAVLNEEQRVKANNVAETLRSYNVETEVYFKSPKLGKQIDYAAGKQIPYVLFIGEENDKIEIKDLNSKEQVSVSDLGVWAKGVAR